MSDDHSASPHQSGSRPDLRYRVPLTEWPPASPAREAILESKRWLFSLDPHARHDVLIGLSKKELNRLMEEEQLDGETMHD